MTVFLKNGHLFPKKKHYHLWRVNQWLQYQHCVFDFGTLEMAASLITMESISDEQLTMVFEYVGGSAGRLDVW